MLSIALEKAFPMICYTWRFVVGQFPSKLKEPKAMPCAFSYIDGGFQERITWATIE